MANKPKPLFAPIPRPLRAPPERWRHGPRSAAPARKSGDAGRAGAVERAEPQDPIARLTRAGMICEALSSAAIRFAADYHDGQVTAPVTARLDPQRPQDRRHRPPVTLTRKPPAERAYQRWQRAARALPPEMRDRLITLICEEQPTPVSLDALRGGLTMLSRFYHPA